MNKVYLIPVKKACNANCTFCISKEYSSNRVNEIMDLKNPIILKNLLDSFSRIKKEFNISKFEVTGGGEPFLNNQLQDIINLIKKEFYKESYIKLYSNGFKLKEIYNVDELNISRSHIDSNINNLIYKSKLQNDLKETLSFFRPMVKELRLCTIMIKGIMDSTEEYSKMVKQLEEVVDTFVLRPLIPEKKSMKDLLTSFEFTHPKLKKDTIDCHCHENLVIAPDGKIYTDFNFNTLY